MNKVMMTGNVVHTPEMRATQSGVDVCNFRIAVQRRFKDASGNRQTDFFDVVAWRQLATLCGKFLQKGRKVLVTGEMQTRQYEGRDGGKRTAFEIIADEVEFLTPNNNVDGETRDEAPARPAKLKPAETFTIVDDDDPLPF